MRHQEITTRPSVFTKGYLSTLLRNKNAEELAALSTEMRPDLLKFVDSKIAV